MTHSLALTPGYTVGIPCSLISDVVVILDFHCPHYLGITRLPKSRYLMSIDPIAQPSPVLNFALSTIPINSDLLNS
ncbi:hypothetical protein XELAEV_18042449mg [Xenopus laevis]|uniref:Uncharacterized protein n=1 Tax=Xenopus laevis TaxID=8355 RepID=A0A974C4C8_XENLA|nr:hypothetical protein XELAEV_18042449mg [Xenopus laevis]